MSDCKRLDCKQVRDLIPLFSEDLDLSEAESVREHVASCTACAAELGIFLSQAARFAQLRTGRPGVDLMAGIEKKLARPAPAGRLAAFPVRRVAVAAAAAGLVLALGLFAFKHETTPVADTIAKKPAPQTLAPRANEGFVANTPRHMHHQRPRIFETEHAQPLFGRRGGGAIAAGGEVELVPLDEEAEVPQTKKSTFAEPQQAQPAPKTGDDDRSLSF